MPYNSTIRQKLCKCGCGAYPTIQFQGWNRLCAPEELRQTVTKKAQATAKRAQTNAIARNLHKQQLANTDVGKKEIEVKIALKRAKTKGNPKSDKRSTLLQLADRVFSRWIKKRDTDKDGYCNCYICGIKYHIDDRDEDNMPILQPLHFVDRDVYSQRYNPFQVKTGCGFCNRKQHYDPTGTQYQIFKEKLIKELGEDEVAEIELSHRNINRVTHAYLHEIVLTFKSTV